ncbi:MAG: DMT family transporter, partial [Candidatus Micrarchaeota archaeon]|nr:DMT family transporter [Candidatus Micrarchaeota archaeon]
SINVSIANSWSIVTIALLLIFLGTHVSQSSAIYIAVIILGTMLVSMELKELRHLNFTKVSKGAPYAFLAMLSWGAAFFFGIILIEDIGWFLASLYLSIGMTTVYIIAYSRTKPKYIDPKPAWAVILLYAVSVTAGSLAFGIGVLNNPLIVTPIAAASPAVTIFMAVAKLKEKLEPNHILGIFMIILGLVALSL